MTTNKDVVDAWANNSQCNTQNMSTDGYNLYSYALKIGFTANGRKHVYNYMSPNYISNTTSHHVSLAKRVCDVVVNV